MYWLVQKLLLFLTFKNKRLYQRLLGLSHPTLISRIKRRARNLHCLSTGNPSNALTYRAFATGQTATQSYCRHCTSCFSCWRRLTEQCWILPRIEGLSRPKWGPCGLHSSGCIVNQSAVSLFAHFEDQYIARDLAKIFSIVKRSYFCKSHGKYRDTR